MRLPLLLLLVGATAAAFNPTCPNPANATLDIVAAFQADPDNTKSIMIEEIDYGILECSMGSSVLSRLQFHSIASFRLCLSRRLDNFTAHVIWPEDLRCS